VLRRWPFVLPFATLACIAARIHVHVGSTEANLLVPMYAVVAAARCCSPGSCSGRRARGGARVRPGRSRRSSPGRRVDPLDAGRAPGLDRPALLLLPFGLLAVALAGWPGARLIAVGLLVELTAMALVFSAIGIYQYETRRRLLEPEAARLERVRAVLPRQLGLLGPVHLRAFLVVAILALLVAVLFMRDRGALGATAAIAGIWAGLYSRTRSRASRRSRPAS
jgi:hypothetical protein